MHYHEDHQLMIIQAVLKQVMLQVIYHLVDMMVVEQVMEMNIN